MRRMRRLGHSGSEFGSSGEDSFVAVVVTKLTGALLFILLLTMVIMALLPKAIDAPGLMSPDEDEREPLTIQTPEVLPEAIAGHPYVVALAATGGRGPLRWAVDGPIPAGLDFDPATAQLRGTPKAGTPKPVSLVLRVGDGFDRAMKTAELVVYESDRPLTTPSRWKPGLPPIPWRAWLEQGFGFLILALIHIVGINALSSAERWSSVQLEREHLADEAEAIAAARAIRRRFLVYRVVVRLATLTAAAALAVWLVRQQG
jgi:Putative Ig domain